MNILSQLELYKRLLHNLVIYVSYDMSVWEKLDEFVTENDEIRAFVVLYTDGQILDGFNEFAPLPEGAYFIEERKIIDQSELPLFKQIHQDVNFVEITHKLSPFSNYDSSLYTTQLTNIGANPFKIKRFTAYTKNFWRIFKNRPKHNTIINGWFSENDFKLWYGQNSEWIQPHETLYDYRNYGNDCFWLYEIQTLDGQIFWVSTYKL